MTYEQREFLVAQEKLQGSKTNHVLHLIISLFTAGLWIPVWILAAMSNSHNREYYKKEVLTGKSTFWERNYFFIVLAVIVIVGIFTGGF